MHRLLFNKTNFLVKPPAINSALQNLNGKLGINQNSAGNQINKSHQRKTHVLTKTSALWLFTLWGKTQNFVILYLINNVRYSILEINLNPSYPLRALWCYIHWSVDGLLQKQQNLNQTQHCLGGSRKTFSCAPVFCFGPVLGAARARGPVFAESLPFAV